MRKITPFVLIVMFFVAACAKSQIQDNFESPCRLDSDCIKVSSGCCGCVNGGIDKAISKDKLKEYNSQRETECKGTLCPRVISDDPSCSLNPMCVENACTLG